MTRNLSYSCLLLFLASILLSSCSSSSDVASDGFFQKRKYRNGIHLNLIKKKAPPVQSIPDSAIAHNSLPSNDFNPVSSPENILDQTQSKSTSDGHIALSERLQAKKQSVIAKAVKRFAPKEPIQSLGEESGGPDIEQGKGTITGKYQKRGKLALFFAWMYALMPALGWTAGFLALPGLQLLAAVLGLFALVMALILGFSNSKYSDHARKALWLVLIAFLAWIAIGTILNLVLAVALI